MLGLALRPPLAALWASPACAPDAAAWRPLLSTLEHIGGSTAAAGSVASVATPSGQHDGCMSIMEAHLRLRLHLAEAAAAASDDQLAVRLLERAPGSLPDAADPAAASPLRLLTDLCAADLRARLPVATTPGVAGAGDPVQGSGRAPASAARLCQLLDSCAAPSDGSGPHSIVSGLLQGGQGAATSQPVVTCMPAAVRDAAARGGLLLARWAQVRLIT